MIGIIDYGLGNIKSVAGAVTRLGEKCEITSDPVKLEATDKIILPGVGAFGDGMQKLHQRKLIAPLSRMVMEQAKPILGICLGFQLIADGGEEFGEHTGLGWIRGQVRKLSPNDPELRLPHVGWNGLFQKRTSPILQDVPEDALFYYVHNYYLDTTDDEIIVGECEYGGRFTAAIQWRNIWATQFHPEKSQRHGLTVLKNFITHA